MLRIAIPLPESVRPAMIRSLVLSFLLTAVIFVGSLLLFPAQWVVAIFALLALISAQIILVRRHLRKIPPWERQEATPRPVSSPAADSPAADSERASPASGEIPAAQSIDSDVFSRFRSQLESAEQLAPQSEVQSAAQSTDDPAAATVGPSPAATPDGVEDTVQISSAVREKSVTMEALREPHPDEDESLDEDLFEDLRTDPGKISAAAAAGEPKLYAPPHVPIAASNDVPDNLEAVQPSDSEPDDASTLLNLVNQALQRKDVDGARAGLQNYFGAMGAATDGSDWHAHLASMRLAALERQPARVTEAFELMLKHGYPLLEEEFAALLDEMLPDLDPDDRPPLRVSLLVRALSVFRQSNDRAAMDRLYGHIEQAQESSGDEEKLIRFLKNHLEIKKVMQDVPGQMDLIDQIGNRLYKLGQTDEAREFYESGLELRAVQEQSEADLEAPDSSNSDIGGSGETLNDRGLETEKMQTEEADGQDIDDTLNVEAEETAAAPDASSKNTAVDNAGSRSAGRTAVPLDRKPEPEDDALDIDIGVDEGTDPAPADDNAASD